MPGPKFSDPYDPDSPYNDPFAPIPEPALDPAINAMPALTPESRKVLSRDELRKAEQDSESLDRLLAVPATKVERHEQDDTLEPSLQGLSFRGDPFNLPFVEHSRYLLNATSFRTAHVQLDYPYGHWDGMVMRCFRRCWAEQSASGAKRGQWRLLSQTSLMAVNKTYTIKLTEAKQTGNTREFLCWRKSTLTEMMLFDGRPYWNQPKLHPYSLFAVWEEADCRESMAPTAHIRKALRPCTLHWNSRPVAVMKFLSRGPHVSPSQYESIKDVIRLGSERCVDDWEGRFPLQWEHYLKIVPTANCYTLGV
jgi:hypothetical protein